MGRRAGRVKWIGELASYTVLGGRIRPDQAVEVARLELVGVRRQRLEVADPEVAGARAEDVGERQRAQRGVAARAAAPDGQPVGVDLALSPPGSAPR